MRMTQLFTKTRKDAPAEEVAKNAQLLIRAGFIYKVMAGVYAYTPLGLAVLENIKQIVREEMNAISGQELIMTNLQRPETWQTTGRWDDEKVDVWFKTKLQDGSELGLAWSHEEPIMEMMKGYINSYRDLPINVYQFQNKLRNELRSKSGIMRGREFIMKDMYSLSVDAEQHEKFYQASIDAYNRVFDRLGIGDDTFVTYASGGAFTEFSHEFQTICDAGEDVIYVNEDRSVVLNEEVTDDATLAKLGVSKDDLEPVKAAEVGNIFNFGTQKSEEMDVHFTNEDGEKQYVHLGSYGIGITRVMGVLAEKFSDDNGLVWPKGVGPADVHIVRIGDDEEVVDAADKLYADLEKSGVSVLYDDRNDRVGNMLGDADLIGVPMRAVISSRSLKDGGAEVKMRTEPDSKIVPLEDLVKG